MIIGPYTISSTRGLRTDLHVCRIKRHNGAELICEVFPGKLDPDRKGHTDPFRFLRMYPQSNTRREFMRFMQENNVPLADVEMLLTAEPDRGVKRLKPRKIKENV